jgi:hypothetical protein
MPFVLALFYRRQLRLFNFTGHWPLATDHRSPVPRATPNSGTNQGPSAVMMASGETRMRAGAGRIARHGRSSRTAMSSGSSATVVLPLVQETRLPRTSSRLVSEAFKLSVIVVSLRSGLSLKTVR